MNWLTRTFAPRPVPTDAASTAVPARETLRVFRCPSCDYSHRDAEVTFLHLWSHVEADRLPRDRRKGSAA